LQFDETNVIEFLTLLFRSGASYNAINSARSALSTILINELGCTIGNSPIVKRFLKGVFELKPSVARYEVIWDVNLVLDYLTNLPSEIDMPLSLLTHKLVMLLALASKQRAQTLHSISVDDIKFSKGQVIIPIRKLLKHMTQSRHKLTLNLKEFSVQSICVVRMMRLYLTKTASIRGEHKQLFISYSSPISLCRRKQLAVGLRMYYLKRE